MAETVEAKVIDRDLAHPLDAEMAEKAERLKAEREELAKCVADLRELTPDELKDEDAAQVRAWRKDVNAHIGAVEAIRKEVKSAYLAPLERWEAEIKESVTPARFIKDMLSADIKRRQDAERDLREQGLRLTYEGYMRDNGMSTVLELLPWERIREPKWLNKSVKPTDACDEIYAKVDGILADRDALRAQLKGSRFLDEAEAALFRTLDLGEAMRTARDREAEQERLEAARAEQSEVEAWRREAEHEPEPEPEPEPQPAPEPEQPAPEHGWTLVITATDDQVARLIAAMRELGIHGRLKREEEHE
jgi:hypothetical protein